MAGLRFTDRVENEKTVLRADSPQQARRLFDYARRVATADYQIDLLSQFRCIDSHTVVFEEIVPRMSQMQRTR